MSVWIRRLWVPGAGLVLAMLASCVGVGYDGDVGFDYSPGYIEPYGYEYGGWGPGYVVGPRRGGDRRRIRLHMPIAALRSLARRLRFPTRRAWGGVVAAIANDRRGRIVDARAAQGARLQTPQRTGLSVHLSVIRRAAFKGT